MSCHKTEIDFIVINSLDEIPEFATEAEEAAYWGNHSFSEELLDAMLDDADELPPPGTAFGLSLSLSPDIAQRLRVLAKKKDMSYVKLAKQFVLERLYEEEKREGIIGEREAS